MIDLYSDTQTRPTPGMRAAMAAAPVGDEQSDDDPSTNRLCERVAALVGHKRGLFLPSGTMCNLIAVLVHANPGDELICEDEAHICGTEGAGAAAVGGVAVRTVASRHGVIEPEVLRTAIRPASRTAPRSALLCVEQTTNFAGGAIWPLSTLDAVRDVAHGAGLRSHLDGARLLNASVASGIDAARYAKGWDSVWLDLTKGLGCPVGAVLCGEDDFIEAAWRCKVRLGGALRQSGVLAAAGLYALDNHVERLAEDHQNARLIWARLRDSGLFAFDPEAPHTNILRFRLAETSHPASEFARRCRLAGVRIRAIDQRWLRVTTHLDVSQQSAALAADILVQAAAALSQSLPE